MDAFAQQLTEVRNLDTEGKYKKQLDKLEVEYQFILLRSLHLFHKEMGRSNLLERLNHIKERLCDTEPCYPAFPNDHPFIGFDQNIKTCRNCKRETLRLRQFSNELCCEHCGLLEPLDGAAFNYNELYHCGGEMIRRTNEAFQFIDQKLPTRISMPFVAYKILKEIVPERPEHCILNYFWLQVPQGSVWKHKEKWQNMLRQFEA